MCIIMVFLQVQSVNYQDRCLYYNEKDNVCHVTLDLILLRINLDGVETVTHTAWGETSCSEGEIYYWKMLNPSKRFADSDDNFDIYFSQETKRVYVLGVLQQIIQRTRVVNATIRDVPYHCEIIGDGTAQHFGIDIPNSPPCKHFLKCDRIAALE